MVEAELVICHLRSQVRSLQSLLNYLENRDAVGHEEYGYVQATLRDVIERLKEMQRFSSERGEQHLLRAQWLN